MKKITALLCLLIILLTGLCCVGFVDARYASSHDVTTELVVNITANRYNLTLDANGGEFDDTSSTKNITVNYKGTYGELPAPSRTGYTCEGWFTQATDGTQINGSDTVEITKNTTIYAHWTANTYTIAYDSNTGSGTMASVSATYDKDVTLSANAFTKTGYTFNGWNTKPDGSGTSYADKATVKNLTAADGDTMTLYAQWKANTYTVKYNANSGEGEMADQTFIYDDSEALSANGFTRTGYTFDGWNTEADGSGIAFEDKKAVKNLTATDGAAVTLYAQWKVIDYKITYIPNGGTVPADADTSYNVEDPATLPAPSRDGYEFKGWFEDEDLTNGPVTSTEGKTGNKTYYAKWEAKDSTPYTVRHWQQNLTGGTEHNDENFTLEDTENLTGTTDAEVTPARKSYEGFTAPAAQTVTITGDGKTVVNYYYTRNSYTVTLNKGTGIASVSGAGNYKYGASVTIDAVVSNGYKWSGWTGTHSTTNQQYTFTMPASAVADTANATLETYTITYNLDGGEVDTANPTSYNVTTATFNLSNPAKTGYIFAGWTGSNGTTAQTSVSVAKGSTGNKTFTANWTANTYTVAYNANGGSGTMANSSHTYGTSKALTANAFTRTGYTFNGWNTKADGSGTPYADKASVKNLAASGTVTLYAQWKIVEYTITYNLDGGQQGSNAKTSYNITTETFNLPTPTKTGYTFGGWFTTSNFSGTAVTQITKGSTGNKTYYAKWEEDGIIFFIDGNKYVADKGMTWAQWVKSPYNEDSLTVVNGTMIGGGKYGYQIVIDENDTYASHYGYNPFLANEAIVNGRNYQLMANSARSDAKTATLDLKPKENCEIMLIWEGIDDTNMDNWYPVDEQIPMSGDSYEIAFEPAVGCVMSKTITVLIDDNKYVVYTDGQTNGEETVPIYDPEQNILTIPAELLTEETQKVAIIASAEEIVTEETVEETESTEPTEPAESIESADSTEPTEPAKPAESADSTEPTEPAEPAESADSTEPTEPAEPTESAELVVPTESFDPTDKADSSAN